MASKYVIKILGDDKQFKRATRGVQRGLDGIKRSVTGLQGVFAGLGAAITFKGIIDATVRQENAMRQLEQRIISTGGAAGYTADDLAKMASQLQGITTYGDEAIMEMQGLLLTFTQIRGPVFQEATEAVLNMSTALGTDLRSASLQLGKALNDPIRGVSALAEAGIQFNDSQRDTIKALVESGRVADAQRMILGELEVQFGGAARAAADTFGGSLTQLKNAFGDLLEADDGLPAATASVQDLTALLQDPSTKEAFDIIVEGIIKITNAAVKGVVAVRDFGKQVRQFLEGPSGALPGEVDAIDDEITRVEEKIERFNEIKADESLWSRLFGMSDADADAYMAQWQERLDNLQALRQLIVSQEEELAKEGKPPPPPVTPTPATPAASGAILTEKEFEEAVKASEAAVLKENAAYQNWLDTQRQAAEQVKAGLDPNYELIQQLEQLDVLLNMGLITWDQWAAASLNVQERMDELAGQSDETGKQMSEFSIQAARNMQSAFADFLFDPFEDGLKGLLNNFVQVLRRMAAEAVAAKLAEKMFGEAGGGTSGSSGWFGAAVDFAASFFHSGGMVGHGGRQAGVSPLVFAGAPRLHTGGYLKPDEVPAILQTGEEVLSRNDPRNVANGGGSGTRIVNVIDPNMVSDYLSSASGEKVLVNVLQRNAGAIKQVLV